MGKYSYIWGFIFIFSFVLFIYEIAKIYYIEKKEIGFIRERIRALEINQEYIINSSKPVLEKDKL